MPWSRIPHLQSSLVYTLCRSVPADIRRDRRRLPDQQPMFPRPCRYIASPFLSCIPSSGLYINIDYSTLALPSLLCVHLKYDNTPSPSPAQCQYLLPSNTAYPKQNTSTTHQGFQWRADILLPRVSGLVGAACRPADTELFLFLNHAVFICRPNCGSRLLSNAAIKHRNCTQQDTADTTSCIAFMYSTYRALLLLFIIYYLYQQLQIPPPHTHTHTHTQKNIYIYILKIKINLI
jgi:hypothetical protein